MRDPGTETSAERAGGGVVNDKDEVLATSQDGLWKLQISEGEIRWGLGFGMFDQKLTAEGLEEVLRLDREGDLIWRRNQDRKTFMQAVASAAAEAESPAADAEAQRGSRESAVVLKLIGGVVMALGVVLVIGNLSGGMPTFAFAGFIVGIIGVVIFAVGNSRS